MSSKFQNTSKKLNSENGYWIERLMLGGHRFGVLVHIELSIIDLSWE